MGGDHKCPVCKATFTRPQHVARHMRSHTGDRPYKCNFCGDQFARSDLLSRHVNKCHPNEELGGAQGVGAGRRGGKGKGMAGGSRAMTSKQACDQCVQGSLPCDGCNPCAKCISRKMRCTFVKFHRQTAPAGPGHNGPIPSSSSPLAGQVPTNFTSLPYGYSADGLFQPPPPSTSGRPNTTSGVPSEWSTQPQPTAAPTNTVNDTSENPFAFTLPDFSFNPFLYGYSNNPTTTATATATATPSYYQPLLHPPPPSHPLQVPHQHYYRPTSSHSTSSSSIEPQSASSDRSSYPSLANGTNSNPGNTSRPSTGVDVQCALGEMSLLSDPDANTALFVPPSQHASQPPVQPQPRAQQISHSYQEETPKEREMRELREFWREYMRTPLTSNSNATPNPWITPTNRARTNSLPQNPNSQQQEKEPEDLSRYEEEVKKRRVGFDLCLRENMMRYTRTKGHHKQSQAPQLHNQDGAGHGSATLVSQQQRPSFKRLASQTLESENVKSRRMEEGLVIA